MKKIFKHLQELKKKPHHIRHRVAVASAAFGSILIAFFWLVGNLATGSFALKETSFADLSQSTQTLQATTSGNQNVAGVSAAAILQNSNTPAHIEIVDVPAASSSKKGFTQTTIPF